MVEDREHFNVRNYLREPLYTYESKKVSDLLMELRKTSNNIVIVLDEYGATAGLATLEDILEEIVGDIRDEYDGDEEEEFVEVAPREYVVEGAMKLDDLNDRLGLNLESEDYDSIGGFMIERLDHLPDAGEEMECDGMRLVVDAVDRNRIDKVHIYLPAAVEDEKDLSK